MKVSLPEVTSIYSAEVHAISLACTLIETQDSGGNSYIICSDSLSWIQSLVSISLQNYSMQRLQVRVHLLIRNGKNLVLIWVHMASAVCTGMRPLIELRRKLHELRHNRYVSITQKRRIYEKWRERRSESRRDLSTIKPSPGRWCRQRAHRKEEVIINQLRLRHTRATHGYLFDGIEARQSPCRWCADAAVSVLHMLLECVGLVEERRVLLQSKVRDDSTIVKFIGEYSSYEIVLNFLREIGIYGDL